MHNNTNCFSLQEIPMNHPDKIEVAGSGMKNRYRTIIPSKLYVILQIINILLRACVRDKWSYHFCPIVIITTTDVYTCENNVMLNIKLCN